MQGDVRVGGFEGVDLRRAPEHQVRIGLLELSDHGVAQPVAGLEIRPRRVGRHSARSRKAHGVLDVGVLGLGEVHPHLVQGAEADIAPAGHVEGEEIRVDAHEVVADRVDDVEVHRLRLLAGDAAQDRARPELLVARLRDVARRQRHREGPGVVRRVQEGVEERDVLRLAVGIEHREGLADQRMADAVHRGGELVRDPRVGVLVVARVSVAARALDAADQHVGELVEDDALIFRLVEHLGGLEQLLTRAREAGGLQVLDMEVVVSRPDRVHRGERHVLVRAPVARHVVVEEVHVGVGVEEQRMAAAHEVRHQAVQHIRVVGAGLLVEEAAGGPARQGVGRVIRPERDGAAGQVRRVEDGVGVPMVLDQLAQGRQELEARIRRVGSAREQVRSEAPRAVALPQELADEFGRAIGLVLVDEGRGLVEVLRDSVLVAADRAAGQIRRVVGAGRAARARLPDHDRAVAALAQEIEPVVEILAEGHEEDIRVLLALRQIRFLRAEDVADRPRVEPGIERVDGAISVRIPFPVMRLGEPDEGLIGRAPVRMLDVVARPLEVADAGGLLGVVVTRMGGPAVDEVLEPGEVARRQREGTGLMPRSAVARPGAVIRIDRGLADHRHARAREGDAPITARQRRLAVAARHAPVIGGGETRRELDDVRRPKRAEDGVVAAMRAEDDPVV
ncbi:hypothetical protein AEGHOMDF_3840 [Methylobacterium soli]|nr:hypothetical protein AEGHOMDF_3840 [Methylobacterium soli]